MKQSKQTGGSPGNPGFPFGLPTPYVDGIPEAFRPFIEMGMKLHSEVLKLWGHRARAWLDWPENYVVCKTMDDLTKAQSGYLERMQHDYAHFLDSIMQDMLIEQDEYEDDDGAMVHQPETGDGHREAA